MSEELVNVLGWVVAFLLAIITGIIGWLWVDNRRELETIHKRIEERVPRIEFQAQMEAIRTEFNVSMAGLRERMTFIQDDISAQNKKFEEVNKRLDKIYWALVGKKDGG